VVIRCGWFNAVTLFVQATPAPWPPSEESL
jgi:hypothetical protein